jgi:hypothetical protein
MMRLRFFPAVFSLACITAFLLLTVCVHSSQAADSKFQAILVWATDDSKPPEGKESKPLDPEIRKQLKSLKWKNYFEVKRIDFAVPPNATKKVPISEKCELEVKDLGTANVEVALYGKGKEVARVKRIPLAKGEIFVPYGNSPNETAWLVILKRVE